MPVLTAAEVKARLGASSSASEAQVAEALAAEKAAQAKVCVTPADDAAWPADLEAALVRRVARYLALKGLPLGLQTAMSEAAVVQTRIPFDNDIARLEAPHSRAGLVG
jgi:hypothetical protein